MPAPRHKFTDEERKRGQEAAKSKAGRPKDEVKALARVHTAAAVETLASIMLNGEKEAARVAAATSLLDRGWGKPTQPLSGDEERPPVSFIVVRPMDESGDAPQE